MLNRGTKLDPDIGQWLDLIQVPWSCEVRNTTRQQSSHIRQVRPHRQNVVIAAAKQNRLGPGKLLLSVTGLGLESSLSSDSCKSTDYFVIVFYNTNNDTSLSKPNEMNPKNVATKTCPISQTPDSQIFRMVARIHGTSCINVSCKYLRCRKTKTSHYSFAIIVAMLQIFVQIFAVLKIKTIIISKLYLSLLGVTKHYCA